MLQPHRREGRPRVEGVRQVDEEGWTLPCGGLLSAPSAVLGADGAPLKLAGRQAGPSQLLGRRVGTGALRLAPGCQSLESTSLLVSCRSSSSARVLLCPGKRACAAAYTSN